jgi:hypothetical protein
MYGRKRSSASIIAKLFSVPVRISHLEPNHDQSSYIFGERQRILSMPGGDGTPSAVSSLDASDLHPQCCSNTRAGPRLHRCGRSRLVLRPWGGGRRHRWVHRRRRHFLRSEDIANDEDTEGHMPFRKSALPDTDKSVGADDTEDHMPHRRPALPAADESVDADDTEGHALKAH